MENHEDLLCGTGNYTQFFCNNISGKLGFPCGIAGKESGCNAGDQGLVPGLGRFPGEGNSDPLQYAGLENPMDGIVRGVAKRQTRLSACHFPTCVAELLDHAAETNITF